MTKILKKLSPVRIIALGFALTILLGSFLLALPCSVKSGVEPHYLVNILTHLF